MYRKCCLMSISDMSSNSVGNDENDSIITLDGQKFLCKKMVMTKDKEEKMGKRNIRTFEPNFISTPERCPDGQFYNM